MNMNDAISSYTLDNLYGCKGDIKIIGGSKYPTVKELRVIASKLNVQGRSSMNKMELIKAINKIKSRSKK